MAATDIVMDNLEEPEVLPSRCRDPNARRLLREAVGCYQAGAHRAAVVSTWIAVVYDLFGKLRELAQAGDANAIAKVAEIEKAVDTHNVCLAQSIESTILTIAKGEFELVSSNEHDDLLRLYEDRHRCAHPSLNRAEEIYSPPPELVRLHLRNAVVHLLSHPPVQGRAALARLQQEVDSDFFPKTSSEAEAYFRGGIFARMKDSLLRGFCGATISSCLTDETLALKLFNRRVRALMALRSIQPGVVNSVLSAKLSPAARRASDAGFERVLLFVATVADSFAFLDSDVKLRAETFVKHADVNSSPVFFRSALRVAELADAGRERLNEVSGPGISQLLRLEKRPEFLDRAVELYVGSSSWNMSNTLALTVILPNAEALSEGHIRRILDAFAVNLELYESAQRAEVLRALNKTGRADPTAFASALAKCAVKPEDVAN
jgi:hypothetical protein